MNLPIGLFNIKALNAATMASSIDSSAIDLSDASCIAIHIIWSGTAVANDLVVLQGSNDGVNWANVDTTTLTSLSGNALVNKDKPGYFFARVSYSRVAATAGSLTVHISAKR